MPGQPLFDRQRYRRFFGPLAVLSLIVAVPILMSPRVAAQLSSRIGATSGRQITLQQQLTKGLKATTKADKAFISRVVKEVGQGRLPRKLVDRTFLWARNRALRKSSTRRLRPMVYFRPGLTQQAKRFGVKL